MARHSHRKQTFSATGFARAFSSAHCTTALLIAVQGLWLVGCGDSNQFVEPPPPAVTVAQPIQMSVTRYLEETGTTEPVQMVEIRARVKGFLEKQYFDPGDQVEKDEVLYLIQQQEYQAIVAAEKANLLAMNVVLGRAETEYERQQKLFKEMATAETKVVAAKAERDAALAAVDAAKASLDQAALDLSYTEVRSPISGRVGKTLVKEKNLVGDNESTHLTTVVSYDPIYANFNISERSLLWLMEQSGGARRKQDRNDTKIFLRRANDAGFAFEGHFDYADLGVDQSTGTFMIRGIFPNPDLAIAPGLFVRVRVPIEVQQGALLVPERALGGDQSGRYILVVNSKNIVERRGVTVGTKLEQFVVVEGKVLPEDWVITEGIQRSRPGAEVSPQRTKLTRPKESTTVQSGSPDDIDSPEATADDDAANGNNSSDGAAKPDPDTTPAKDDAADSDSSGAKDDASTDDDSPSGGDASPADDAATKEPSSTDPNNQ